MTRHLPHWAGIWRLGSEHIFEVCVVTFDSWHLAILFDWVQGIMFGSQGKVLSPGNEGSPAVNVYVSIFPQLCFICLHMPISGLPLWCNSCTCSCVECQRGTSTPLEARSVDCIWIVLGSWVLQGSCVKERIFVFFVGNADPGEEQDPRSDGLWWKAYSRGRSW